MDTTPRPASPPPAPATVPRLDSLTGLRFLAALLVFAFHIGLLVPNTGAAAWLHPALSPGLSGVAFFFVLSGFVLAWTQRPRDRATAFYRRRFARIFPAYWAALLVVVVAKVASPPEEGLRRWLLDAVPSVFAVQAWFPSTYLHYGGNIVGWSVSVEVFFYATFPLLVLLAQRRAGLVALGVLAVVLAVGPALALRPETTAGLDRWAVYVLPTARLGEFVLGALLARAVRSGRVPRVPLPVAGLVVVLAYAASAAAPLWAQVSLVVLAPFVLLIASAARADLDGAPSFLRRRTLVVLGEWSYCFYLLHYVVINGVLHVLAPLVDGPAVLFAVTPVALVASVAAAGALHVVVERPLARRLRGRPLGPGEPSPPPGEPGPPPPASGHAGTVQEHPVISTNHRGGRS